MLGSLTRRGENAAELLTSKLYNESTFYPALMKDLEDCGSELIIESPLIALKRLRDLLPMLQKLKGRGVRIIINTKDPCELGEDRREETYHAVASLQHNGIQIIYSHGHHRKLAIIDRSILYEGSLNILSQYRSSEIMRRTESVRMAWEMARFVGIDRLL